MDTAVFTTVPDKPYGEKVAFEAAFGAANTEAENLIAKYEAS